MKIIIKYIITSGFCLISLLSQSNTRGHVHNVADFKIRTKPNALLDPNIGAPANRPKKSIKRRKNMVASTIISDISGNQHVVTGYWVWFNHSLYYLNKDYVENNDFANRFEWALNKVQSEYIEYCKKEESIAREINIKIQELNRVYRDSLQKWIKKKEDYIEEQETKYFSESKTRAKQQINQYLLVHPTVRKYYSLIEFRLVNISKPDRFGGCDVTIEYLNKSPKSIKYLRWGGCVYNAVGDIVSCEVSDKNHFRGRDTGPVRSNEFGVGKWECIIYNYSAKNIKINEIRIDYMDGSFIIIPKEAIQPLLNAPKSFGQIEPPKIEIDSSIQNNIWAWSKKVDETNEIIKHTDIYGGVLRLSVEHIPSLNSLYDEYLDIKKKREQYEKEKEYDFLIPQNKLR